jgi:drug/metabolite transporter (DMT)-like permease
MEQPWNLNPSIEALSAALALGFFSTALALLIYFRLIKTLGSMGVASQAYLRVAIAVALGVVFLGEQITLVVGIGVMIAIAGVALINVPQRKIH